MSSDLARALVDLPPILDDWNSAQSANYLPQTRTKNVSMAWSVKYTEGCSLFFCEAARKHSFAKPRKAMAFGPSMQCWSKLQCCQDTAITAIEVSTFGAVAKTNLGSYPLFSIEQRHSRPPTAATLAELPVRIVIWYTSVPCT